MEIFLVANYRPQSFSAYVYKNLTRLGHRVSFFSPDKKYDFQNILIPCNPIVNIADLVNNLSSKPDLIVLAESSHDPLIFPTGLDKVKFPVAWWGIDTHFNFRWHKELAKCVDYSFLAMKQYVNPIKLYSGKNNIHWLPLCADETIHHNKNITRDIHCSFVGNLDGKRKTLFEKYKKEFNIQLYTGKTPEEINEIYNHSIMVINVAARNDLNMRVFEAMACGALLVTQFIPDGLLELFTPGKHLLTHHINDTKIIVNQYLKEREKGAEIAAAGNREVMEKHTYINRLNEMLAICGGKSFHKKNEGAMYFISRHRHFKKYHQIYKFPGIFILLKEYYYYLLNKLKLFSIKKFG